MRWFLIFWSRQNEKNIAKIAVFTSFIFHLGIGSWLLVLDPPSSKVKQYQRAKLKVVEVVKPKPVLEPEQVLEPKEQKKEEPKKLEVIKKKPKAIKKVASRKQKNKPPTPKKRVAPVQGLSKSSVVEGGAGIAVPLGNTVFAADEGIRQVQVEQYEADLSSEASLLRQGKLLLSEEALDAEIEGQFQIEVYVTANGEVAEAELPTKIGYQMDQRMIQAALESKFRPATNRFGKPIDSWAIMTIRFEMD